MNQPGSGQPSSLPWGVRHLDRAHLTGEQDTARNPKWLVAEPQLQVSLGKWRGTAFRLMLRVRQVLVVPGDQPIWEQKPSQQWREVRQQVHFPVEAADKK